MLIDKLADGILRVLTPIGPRYIKPSLQQRIYLLWIFRNFNVLPQQVLSHRQQRFIQDLCAEHKFVSLPPTNVWAEAPILGTVERSPSMHLYPGWPVDQRSAAPGRSALAPMVADLRQRS